MNNLQTVVHKGREVTLSTKWWWENSAIGYDQLYCIHKVKLHKKCAACKKEAK